MTTTELDAGTDRARPLSALRGLLDRPLASYYLLLASVGLLLVMLLVLEIVVYFITQRALLNSIDKTLYARAYADPGLVHAVYGPPGFSGGGPGHFGPHHDEHPSQDQEPG